MDTATRDHLARVLGWGDAHVTFDAAVKDLKPELRGKRPAGFPHSPWELVEHVRIAQRDILEFCVADRYEEHTWPDDYWPAAPEPPSPHAWDQSLAGYREDREALELLARDPNADLTTRTPHAAQPTQTYLRAILLIAEPHGVSRRPTGLGTAAAGRVAGGVEPDDEPQVANGKWHAAGHAR